MQTILVEERLQIYINPLLTKNQEQFIILSRGYPMRDTIELEDLIIPQFVLDMNISQSAKSIFAIILMAHEQNKVCDYSNKAFANKLGIDLYCVSRNLSILNRNRYITISGNTWNRVITLDVGTQLLIERYCEKIAKKGGK